MAATFVLVGGEAYEWQGIPQKEKREFQHTSVEFIGSAYQSLRQAGVPRDRIITVVQLRDYLDTLISGEGGALTNLTGIPPKWYTEQREKTQLKCQLLLEEGGASYDGEMVNPATVWSVLLGEPIPGSEGPVVPADETGAIVFGIYSHGDCHPAGGANASDEWFAHFPYESTRSDIYDFVATEGATDAGVGKNRPDNYLYSTQLRIIFHQILGKCPSRPILGLLNYCLSGGNLEFMRRESVRQHLQVDKWPLFLMSSSGSKKESMVAGMWDAFFQQLQSALQSDPTVTVRDLFFLAETAYFKQNLYELMNAVKARVYVPTIWQCKFSFPGHADDSIDPWHLDLERALTAAIPVNGSTFSFDAASELHRAYEAGEAFVRIRNASPIKYEFLKQLGGVGVDERTGDLLCWMNGDVKESHLQGMDFKPCPVRLVEYSGTQETGGNRNLGQLLEIAISEIARPDEVHGTESGIESVPLSQLFLSL